MWDDMEPSTAWVMRQLPPIMRTTWPESLELVRTDVADGNECDHEAVMLAHIHALGGACLALGLRYAGTEPRCTLF